MSLLLLLNPHGTITPPSGGHPTADETALRALTLEVDEDVAKLVNLTRAGKHLYVTNHGPGVCYFTVGANGSYVQRMFGGAPVRSCPLLPDTQGRMGCPFSFSGGVPDCPPTSVSAGSASIGRSGSVPSG